MSGVHPKVFVLFAIACTAMSGRSQDAVHGTLTMGLGNIADLKQKAELGDAKAQVALGDSLASQFHATEALGWYRKAARQGNVQGQYHVGQMLLFGSVGIPDDLSVRANPVEGVRWTFAAATNLHPNALRNLGKALRYGLGTSTNLVEAYAWLNLLTATAGGSMVGRVEMNEVALQLDAISLRHAQALAAQFKAGRWSEPVTRTIPEGDPRLKLNGITYGVPTPLAVINGKTLSEGESVKVAVKPGALRLTVKCLKIQKDSVLVSIEGEDFPRLLRLE